MWYVKQAFWYLVQFSTATAVLYFFKYELEGDEGPYAGVILALLSAYLMTYFLSLIIDHLRKLIWLLKTLSNGRGHRA